MSTQQFDDKDKYIHRDLSWLMFNERVLEEALEGDNPLLERAKFVAIFMNNLDEFLMVRYAGIKRLLDAQFNQKDAYGYYPIEIFRSVRLFAVGSACCVCPVCWLLIGGFAFFCVCCPILGCSF